MIDVTHLQRKSKELRLKVLETSYRTGKGHIGSAFSIIDILVTLYYTDLFDVSKDIMLMGKGHACLPVYCILNDFEIINDAYLAEYGTNGGRLGIQFDTSIPTIEYNTGSLGHVFGIGLGLAVSKKHRRVFVIVGDGECEEGSIWETADFAARNCKRQLILIVDRNKLGILHHIEDDRLLEKFRAFGLKTTIVNGHSHHEIYTTLRTGLTLNEPFVVIADTVKGKGVSFMEDNMRWHTGVLSQEQYEQAKTELENG